MSNKHCSIIYGEAETKDCGGNDEDREIKGIALVAQNVLFLFWANKFLKGSNVAKTKISFSRSHCYNL